MAATADKIEPQKKWLRPVLIGVVALLVLALAIWGVRLLMGGKTDKPKQQPKLTLIPDKPPPPPPPPKEEKKPEPPKDVKEVKMEQVAKQAQPPADPSLKMEGAAGDGPSLFSRGTVTNEDLRMGTGAMDPFNAYGASIKSELQRFLAKRAELKRLQYKIEVRVWVGEDGRMKRYELLGTTNDSATDEMIRSSLAAFSAFSDAPPMNMPQPIRLRIVAGGRA